MNYVRVLFTEMAVIQSLLSELPPGTIICHDWDRLGDEDQASDIAAFISPNEDVARLVKSTLVDSVAPNRVHNDENGDSLLFGGADALISRLQTKLDTFQDRYCGPKRST